MCTIMCYIGKDIKFEDFEVALQKTETRGPDMTKFLHLPSGIMGFQRLSIMDLTPSGMQPFTNNNDADICNGEIYGFRTIKDNLISKGYSFNSNSDCEILLPMDYEYGLDMFSKLDAEFSTVIYDGKFTSYCDITSLNTNYCNDDLNVICSNIHDKLVSAIEKRIDADAPVGFLLSGGLDSSLFVQ